MALAVLGILLTISKRRALTDTQHCCT